MGHYDCPGCGQFNCVCTDKETPDDTLGKWMIDSNFEIIKSDTQPWIFRLKATLYKTKKQAKKELPAVIRAAIDKEEIRHKERMSFLNRSLENL